MRKLSLVMLAVMAAMAVGATSAQATYEVRDMETEEPCPAVEVTGYVVTGGCLVDGEGLAGPWDIYSGEIPIDRCGSSFNMRIDSVGKFYGVNTNVWCNAIWRKACQDEKVGSNVPWPGLLSGPNGKPIMGMCVEFGGGGDHIPLSMEFELELGPNGELGRMLQTNEYGGVKNAKFTNYDPESVLITDVP